MIQLSRDNSSFSIAAPPLSLPSHPSLTFLPLLNFPWPVDENGEYNYDTATALLVTFIVNNHIDKNSDDYKMAEAWETAYLNYLHNYTREHVNTSIKITFSSEVQTLDTCVNFDQNTDF